MNVKDYVALRNYRTRKNHSRKELKKKVHDFTEELVKIKYVKNFTWLGQPILQYPSDLMVMQELITELQPDFIIETGVAFGGMTLFYAGILQALHHGSVIGVDIKIRKMNRDFLENHYLGRRIILLEQSSIYESTIETINYLISRGQAKTILVSLDSNHSHDHVLKELELYSPLVTKGSYLVVFDTAIEDFMKTKPKNRPWGPGNNPKTAVMEFLEYNKDFKIDYDIESRALITAAPSGWLKKCK